MSDTPEILTLDSLGDHRFAVRQPEETPEGRDVVFSGLLLGQMLMASDAEAAEGKVARSVHSIFARAGVYSKPLELTVESMQAGRTWASDTVTATQDGKLISRGLVLLNTLDPDVIRHSPDIPAGVPAPDDLEPSAGQVMPGVDWRPVSGERTDRGVPVEMAWHRFPQSISSVAANQAVLAWATCGNVIGLAMRPHRESVDISQAHRTLSTGVIAHTLHFVDTFDISEWLLIVTEGTSAAQGRVHGGGSVFSAEGRLVATFHQDSMVKAVEGAIDPRRGL